MLTDQSFAKKPIIALGRSAFVDDRGDLSYTTTLYLRELPNVREMFDFHYHDIDSAAGRADLATLQDWGAPVFAGVWWPWVITPKLYKEFLRTMLGVEVIQSKKLCEAYRYAGRKNVSTVSGEKLFHALSLAAVDPEPGALRKHLLRGDLQ